MQKYENTSFEIILETDWTTFDMNNSYIVILLNFNIYEAHFTR